MLCERQMHNYLQKNTNFVDIYFVFLVNVVGIVFASMLTFSLMNVHGVYKVAGSTLTQEERRILKEKKSLNKEI
jgi:hypothetical protein